MVLVSKASRVWGSEVVGTLLLVFLVAQLFFVPFLAGQFPVLEPATTIVFILLLLSGVLALSRSLVAALGASLLVGAAITLELVHRFAGEDPFGRWRIGFSALAIGLFAMVTLFRVFAPGDVTTHRLVGAVAAYLLVGLAWSYLYELVALVDPGAFRLEQLRGHDIYPALRYFSFVTLTTTGYGDVLPISPAARALANLEGLVGVLFPAVLIGRLLSLHGTTRSPEPR